MFVKIFLLYSFALVLIRAQLLDKQLINNNFSNDLKSSSLDNVSDLMAAESGKAVVVGAGKQDVIAKKGVVKGLKASKNLYEIGGKKFGKKVGKIAAKKFNKKLLKKEKKLGAFGGLKKGFKKYNKKKGFNKIGGFGFKKKSINVKSFTDNKGFKFGKTNGFLSEKAVIAGLAKKGGKFKVQKVDALDKKFKGGKKALIKIKAAKSGKKVLKAGKVGFGKGSGKSLKKTLKKSKKLKKIG